jgi:hypothetical protein
MANPGSPTLVTPANEAFVVGNVLVFVFIVPSDDDNQRLVFRVEMDTVNPPSSSNINYKVNESRFANDNKTHGRWEVKDGSDMYVPMPTGGISSDYYGRDARVTIRKQDTLNYPNLLGNWYWRISASDSITCATFNRAVFGQKVFCYGS